MYFFTGKILVHGTSTAPKELNYCSISLHSRLCGNCNRGVFVDACCWCHEWVACFLHWYCCIWTEFMYLVVLCLTCLFSLSLFSSLFSSPFFSFLLFSSLFLRSAAGLFSDRWLLQESLPGWTVAARGGWSPAGVWWDPTDRHPRVEEPNDQTHFWWSLCVQGESSQPFGHLMLNFLLDVDKTWKNIHSKALWSIMFSSQNIFYNYSIAVLYRVSRHVLPPSTYHCLGSFRRTYIGSTSKRVLPSWVTPL